VYGLLVLKLQRRQAGRPYPLSNSFSISCDYSFVRKGEEVLERGLRPLSSILPSPARTILNKREFFLAGEGSGVRYK
jgi:hypothetical protein